MCAHAERSISSVRISMHVVTYSLALVRHCRRSHSLSHRSGRKSDRICAASRWQVCLASGTELPVLVAFSFAVILVLAWPRALRRRQEPRDITMRRPIGTAGPAGLAAARSITNRMSLLSACTTSGGTVCAHCRPVRVAYAPATAGFPGLPARPHSGHPQPSNWGTWVSSCSLVLPNHFCSNAAAVPSRYIWLTALLTASQPLRSPFLMPMPYRS